MEVQIELCTGEARGEGCWKISIWRLKGIRLEDSKNEINLDY
jgi:hypothetical protein